MIDPPSPAQPTPPEPDDLGSTPGQRTHPLTPLVSWWIGLVAVAFFVGRDVVENGFKLTFLEDYSPAGLMWMAMFGLGVGLLSIIGAYFSWRFTFFRLEDDGLAIDFRFIFHENKRVLYRRIQSIDINQPLAARLIGLCKLTIETGGQGNHSLSYLRRSQAEELRQELMRRARQDRQQVGGAATSGQTPPGGPPVAPQHHHHDQDPGTVGPGTIQTPADHPPSEQPRHPSAAAPSATWAPPGTSDPSGPPVLEEHRRLVAQVRPGNIVIGALTSGEFLVSLVLLGIFALVQHLTDGWLNNGYALGALLPMAGIVVNRVIKEWRFRVEALGQGLRISRGMTDLVSQTLPADRVHAIEISQPMLTRPFKLWRVEVTVLGQDGSGDDDDSTGVALSIGTWDDAMAVLREIWPGLALDSIPMNPVPERARWFLWWGQPGHRWGISEQVAITHRGRLGRTISVADHSRAQAVCLHQGPLDRRLRLATVDFELVDGPVQLRFSHLDAEVARRLTLEQPGLARAIREQRAQTGITLANPGPSVRLQPDHEA